jgi:rubrerythrin
MAYAVTASATGMARIPNDPEKADENTDRQALRAVIIAESDAINLYEQMSATAKDPVVKKMLLEIAKEEKHHIGEALELLLRLDPEQGPANQEGKEEVEKMIKELSPAGK